MKDDLAENWEADHGMTKEQSAVQRITPLFEMYKQQADGGEDEQTSFADFLADLMHFTNATSNDGQDEDGRINFDAALSTATMHFSFETNDDDEDDEDEDWWEVFFTLDGKQESTQVMADDEHDARYHAQAKFGSPIEITKVEKV